MSPTTARYIIYFLFVLSVPCTVVPLLNVISLAAAISKKQAVIHFDTAIFYFSLTSIFWPIAAIEYFGSHLTRKTTAIGNWLIKNAAITIYSWFFICLVIGILGSLSTPKIVSHLGYTACPNPHTISNARRGKNLIFFLGPCHALPPSN